VSGIDERPSSCVSNNVFLKIFQSIREDWSYGVGERGEWLLDILPRTSVRNKEGLKGHLKDMIVAWNMQDDDEFDGRRWIRDCNYSYMYPSNWIKDWKPICLFDGDNEFFSPMDYEDAEVLYEIWKAGTLIWRKTR
jgi:hypothetical protein